MRFSERMARNYDSAHFRNHVDWLLGDSVAQLKAVTATGQESMSPAWPVVLRYELELRKEAMKLMNMTSATIAEALSGGTTQRRSSYMLLDHSLSPGRRSEAAARGTARKGVCRQGEPGTASFSATAQSKQKKTTQEPRSP